MSVEGTSGPIPPIKPPVGPQGPTEVTPKGGEEVKQFRGPGAPPGGPETQATEKPSPMAVAERQGRQAPTQQQLQDQMVAFQEKLAQQRANVNERKGMAVRPDQEEGLTKLTDKLNGDMRQIAKNSDTEYNARVRGPGEAILEFVSGWIDGSQRSLSDAMGAVAAKKNPDPAQMMQIQFAVQRASQRAELFTSILSATVGGVKSIMSMQLG